MKILDINFAKGRAWIEEWLGAGHFVSAAVLGSSPFNRGRFQTCIFDEASAEPLRDFRWGWMANGDEVDAWLAEVFDQLALDGAKCVVAEDDMTSANDPGFMNDDIPQARIHDRVLCWCDLDSANGAEAVAETMHIATGYPRNVFVVSRSAAELGLAQRQYVPNGFLRDVTKSLMAVIVSIFDDESYLVWTPDPANGTGVTIESPALPKVRLYFQFQGEAFDPDEITRRLGVEPTDSFRPGDPITKDGRGRYGVYGWKVMSGGDTLEIDDLLSELQRRVDVPAEKVKQLCRDLNVDLAIICRVGVEEAEAAPNLVFPPEFLEWVAEFGVSFSVDVAF
jgi:hypothetical protein